MPLFTSCLVSNNKEQKKEEPVDSNTAMRVRFDYSGAELILEQLENDDQDNIEEIITHPGYSHVLLHSKKYSSKP